MRRTRILWQLFPSYLLIIVVAVAATSSYAFLSLRHFYHEQTADHLTVQARLIGEVLSRPGASADGREVDALVRSLAASTGSRITIVEPSGLVAADSEADPAAMGNHGDRPEIIEALAGGVGEVVRASPTLGPTSLYVAVPLTRDGGVVGAVRTSLPLTTVGAELGAVGRRIVLSAVLLSALAAAVSLVVSRRLARPIEEIKGGAARFARGELGYTLRVPETAELAELAESLNRMAADLDVQVRALRLKRAEEAAVLSAMSEGVVAIGPDERVIAMNPAARRMLRVDAAAIEKRPLGEAVRITGVQRLASRALASDGPVEEEVEAPLDDLTLRGRGTPLLDATGARAGAVLVLTDVTRLRRLEKVRRDFVSNVSHELRTPVTSIRGYAETLLDGSLTEPDETRRFVEIIAKHAERLESIIEDLLFLSRVEQEGGREGIPLREVVLADVVRAAVESRAALAADRGVQVTLACDDALLAVANSELLEHAVANLIDNAVKYSERGAAVEIECRREGEDALVAVRDHGPGIPGEHLGRIFERFYRVDKGRSREQGGTGLGLAIVKHIVQAHGGRVDVESTIGRGSTFTIRVRAA